MTLSFPDLQSRGVLTSEITARRCARRAPSAALSPTPASPRHPMSARWAACHAGLNGAGKTLAHLSTDLCELRANAACPLASNSKAVGRTEAKGRSERCQAVADCRRRHCRSARQHGCPRYAYDGFLDELLRRHQRATSGLYPEFDAKEYLFLSCLRHYYEPRESKLRGLETMRHRPVR